MINFRSLEHRRQSLSVQSICPGDYSGHTSPSARSSAPSARSSALPSPHGPSPRSSMVPSPRSSGSLDLHDTLHSTLAGNLCYYRQTRRSCFIEVPNFFFSPHHQVMSKICPSSSPSCAAFTLSFLVMVSEPLARTTLSLRRLIH